MIFVTKWNLSLIIFIITLFHAFGFWKMKILIDRYMISSKYLLLIILDFWFSSTFLVILFRKRLKQILNYFFSLSWRKLIFNNQNNSYKLKYHVSTHKKIPCTSCGKLIAWRQMGRHMKMAHTEDHMKQHICQICMKGFVSKQHFTEHMNTHTGEKPYTCKYCGKRFGDNRNMRMHERTVHEGYKRS